MAIVPAVAGGLGGVVVGALNGIYQANNILQVYQDNREAINQAVEVAQELAEYIPRPPAGKRLRIHTPPRRPRIVNNNSSTPWPSTGAPFIAQERKHKRRREW